MSQKKGDIEKLFDDVDEEIYMDKKFLKEHGVLQKKLEDIAEEIRGYDRFTVEEEKEIKKIFDEYIKKLEAEEKVEEAHG